MIRARRGLVGQARALFDGHLRGLYRWDDVQLDEPEPRPKLANGRKDLRGKHIERVVVRFCGFVIEMESSEEKPPLGWVRLTGEDGMQIEGTLDSTVWDKIGNMIKGRDS